MRAPPTLARAQWPMHTCSAGPARLRPSSHLTPAPWLLRPSLAHLAPPTQAHGAAAAFAGAAGPVAAAPAAAALATALVAADALGATAATVAAASLAAAAVVWDGGSKVVDRHRKDPLRLPSRFYQAQ